MSLDGPRVPLIRPEVALGSETDLDLQQRARQRFLAVIDQYRAEMHVYCSRMTGSVLDGEDVVQEALSTAYFRLGLYQESKGSMRTWLFRIAHNKCLDFLRSARNKVNQMTSEDFEDHLLSEPPAEMLPLPAELKSALAQTIGFMAPRERACLILKEVLDYTLIEIADLTDTSVGAVKSALHRGRVKLETAMIENKDVISGEKKLSREEYVLLDLYAECFNSRDWKGLETLVTADARLEVVGVYAGEGFTSMNRLYFGNYSQMYNPVYMKLGRIDGEETLIGWQRIESEWVPVTSVRISIQKGRIVSIRDYLHVEYLIANANIDADPPTLLF